MPIYEVRCCCNPERLLGYLTGVPRSVKAWGQATVLHAEEGQVKELEDAACGD